MEQKKPEQKIYFVSNRVLMGYKECKELLDKSGIEYLFIDSAGYFTHEDFCRSIYPAIIDGKIWYYGFNEIKNFIHQYKQNETEKS